jgi:hypothetical protein
MRSLSCIRRKAATGFYSEVQFIFINRFSMALLVRYDVVPKIPIAPMPRGLHGPANSLVNIRK